MAPGCGAEVIRKRREAAELRKRYREQGIIIREEDWLPAKNKKFPYYTKARNADVFNSRMRNIEETSALGKGTVQSSYHRRNDITPTIEQGIKRTICITRLPSSTVEIPSKLIEEEMPSSMSFSLNSLMTTSPRTPGSTWASSPSSDYSVTSSSTASSRNASTSGRSGGGQRYKINNNYLSKIAREQELEQEHELMKRLNAASISDEERTNIRKKRHSTATMTSRFQPTMNVYSSSNSGGVKKMGCGEMRRVNSDCYHDGSMSDQLFRQQQQQQQRYVIPSFRTVTASILAGASNTFAGGRQYKKKRRSLLLEKTVTEMADNLESIFLRDSALFRDCLNPIPLAELEDLDQDNSCWDVP